MPRKIDSSHKNHLDTEVGTIRKDWAGRTRVALIFPNRYHVGMSNLGFQTVYRLLNERDDVVCERGFLPEEPKGPASTLESGRPLADFDLVAFSVSFENDYPNLLSVLKRAGIPLRSEMRGDSDPLVAAGGVASLLNPEPIAPFIDFFLIGEAEALLAPFFEVYRPKAGRKKNLEEIARLPGGYVPSFYAVSYHPDGTLENFSPRGDYPPVIVRQISGDISVSPACSAVITPETSFGSPFLIEVSRGCPHGCRFCSAGFVYRPPRFMPLPRLRECLDRGARLTGSIGLVGAAVSDLPWLGELCGSALQKKVRLSFSSLRADNLIPELLTVLGKGGVKTATIAPDAGSERMRRVINKGISEDEIFAAVETLVSNGIPNLKLYFMIGLPTETNEDVEAITRLCKGIKHRFLSSSRTRGRIGEITLSLNSFVPKPATPFQWAPMEETLILKQKIQKIKAALGPVSNFRVHADVPRWAYIQALLSRGDRRIADLLVLADQNGGNWPRTLKETPVNPDFYVTRERREDERFPWDFIDPGVDKSYLRQEYERALNGVATPPCPPEPCGRCGACP
jgi:radical SAM superfamily enzyme YgiQ (UPF0313 family)